MNAVPPFEHQEDERLGKQVAAELNRGIRDDGLWATCLALARGDEKEATTRYMELRVRQKKTDLVRLEEEARNHMTATWHPMVLGVIILIIAILTLILFETFA